MSKKIIFFDIDGTLLDHEKNLPQTTKSAVQSLKDKGYIVAIATGRAPFMYKELREELEIDSYISFNGQYIVLNGEVFYKNPLQREALGQLTDKALSLEHPVVYMDHDDMKANTPHHQYIEDSISTLKFSHPQHDPDYFLTREIYQALLFCEVGEEKQYEEEFDAFKFVRWHPVSTDILPSGASKAKGIERVIEALKISKEDVYAFGDGLNDIEMLGYVEHGVAMGNAEPETKEAARYETKDVSEDGILHGLKMLGLL
jgi:Cof subfamily protein (haloacid dehalogenase superfamily)